MAYLARVSYTGNGSTVGYALPFSYIVTSHIKAYLANTETSAFTVSGSTLTFTTAPANAVAILIKRVTPTDTRLVDFKMEVYLQKVIWIYLQTKTFTLHKKVLILHKLI